MSQYSYPSSSYTSPQHSSSSSASKPRLPSYPHTASHPLQRRLASVHGLIEPLALHHFLDDHSDVQSGGPHPFFSTATSASSLSLSSTAEVVGADHGGGQRSSPPPWQWMEAGEHGGAEVGGEHSLPSSPHTAAHSSCSSFASASDGLHALSAKGPTSVSPSKFLFDPVHVHVHGHGHGHGHGQGHGHAHSHGHSHGHRHGGRGSPPPPPSAASPSSASNLSPEQQQAIQILAGQPVDSLGEAGRGSAALRLIGSAVIGGVGGGTGSDSNSPHLSPTGGAPEDHRMTLSPLSSQSSASSQSHYLSDLPLHHPPLPRSGSSASSSAGTLGPPPLTPAASKKRKAPDSAGSRGSLSPATAVKAERGLAASAAPSHHSGGGGGPPALSVDPMLPMRAPSAPALYSEMEYWHHLSLLPAPQPGLTASASSPGASSLHSDPALSSSPGHPLFHRLQQPLQPSQQQQQQRQTSPAHALSSPAGSYLSPSPIASLSPFHSLQLYTPHALFSGPSSAATAVSSASGSGVTLAAMPSSSLSFVGPQFNSPLPVASFSLDCSLLEATASFLSLFHIPSAAHLAHLSLFSLLHPTSLLPLLSALEALAQAEEERVALPVLACKLSADAIIRTSTTNMNPHAWTNWVVPPISTGGAAGGARGDHAGAGRGPAGGGSGLSGKVVAAVVAGSGGSGSNHHQHQHGASSVFSFDRTGLVLNIAVESCAYALHHALEHTKPVHQQQPALPTNAAAASGGGGGGGSAASPSSSPSSSSSSSAAAFVPSAVSPPAVSLESGHLRRRFPVTSMCFHCDLLLTPVMDGGGGIHRFLAVVIDRKRSGADDEAGAGAERMRRLVEEKVRKWRDGVRGRKKKKRAKHADDKDAAAAAPPPRPAPPPAKDNGSSSSSSSSRDDGRTKKRLRK